MASSAAMAAARSMPAVYTVPLGPRVRPPRLLPGTKAENTNPQPDGPVPAEKAWVQGKWRELQSNAAKDRRKLQSIQVEKALRHATHGMNIYAYRQLRTNQVVYSLSRVMQNNKILSQLIYHGKQTKPAALRRDVWRPYFSIHFPQNEAGAAAGLDTYQLLRELSSRRQLSPPENSLLATKEDVEKAEGRYDPATLARLKEEKSSDLSKLPKLGQLLPPKYRAKKLMDQKASSVADVAFALAQIKDAKLSPHDRLQKMQERLKSTHLERSRRNRRRINEIRLTEATKAKQIQDRQKLIDAPEGQLTLDFHTAQRIALDHDGVLTAADRVTGLSNHFTSNRISSVDSATSQQLGEKPSDFDAENFTSEFTTEWNSKHDDQQTKPSFPTQELDNLIQQKTAKRKAEIQEWEKRAQDLSVTSKDADGQTSRSVLVLWSDLKDAMNAKSWSDNVQHDWVDAKAVVKTQRSVVRQTAYVDEDGHEIEEQKQTRLFQTSSSPHVMGRDVSDNWMTDREQLQKEAETKTDDWNNKRGEQAVRAMINVRSQRSNLIRKIDRFNQKPKTNPKAKSIHEKRLAALPKIEQLSEDLEAAYPEYARTLDQLSTFAKRIKKNRKYVNLIANLEPGAEGREQMMNKQHKFAKMIRDECDVPFPGFSSAVRKHQDLMATQPSEIKAAESQAELEIRTLQIVLARHQKLLQELGDEDSEVADNSGKTGDKRSLDLKDLDVEVDMQQMGRRGLWSRVKGVFGG